MLLLRLLYLVHPKSKSAGNQLQIRLQFILNESLIVQDKLSVPVWSPLNQFMSSLASKLRFQLLDTLDLLTLI